MPGPAIASNQKLGVGNVTPTLRLLQKDALVHPDPGYSIRSWLNTAQRLYKRAQENAAHGELELAYVHYLKTVSIIVEIIPGHKGYPVLGKPLSDEYIFFRKNLNDNLKVIEDIHKRLADRDNLAESHDQSILSSQNVSPAVQPGKPVQMQNEAASRDSTSYVRSEVGQHKLSDNPEDNSSENQDAADVDRMRFRVGSITEDILESVHQDIESSQSATDLTSRVVSQSQNPPVMPDSNTDGSVVGPFPKASMITPTTLSDYLHRQDPPSILFLDMRSREHFEHDNIIQEFMICIEPLLLREGVTADQLEDALILAPPREQGYFANRHKFDLIVYYDWDSQMCSYHGKQFLEPEQKLLRNISTALNEYAGWHKPLKNMPLMLVGGLRGWKRYCLQKLSSSTGTLRLSSDANPARLKPSRNSGVPAGLASSNIASEEIAIDIEEEQRWLNSLRTSPTGKETTTDQSSKSNIKKLHRQAVVTSANSIFLNNDQYARNVLDFFQQCPENLISQSELSREKEEEERLAASQAVVPSLPLYSNDCYTYTAQTPEKPTEDADIGQVDVAHHSPRHPTFVDHPFYGFTKVNDPAYLEPASKNHVCHSNRDLSPDQVAKTFASHLSVAAEMAYGQTGLRNLGNTCFMNSIVQCIGGTVPLARYFLNGSYKQHLIRDNPLGTKGLIPDALSDLLRHMWDGKYAFLSPITLRETAGKFRPEFKTGDQQDAQEFLAFLLDSLHEDLNRNYKKPKLKELSDVEEQRRERMAVEVVAEIEWARYLHSNNSIVVSLFQGLFRNILQCTHCDQTSTSYNGYMYLSLPIPSHTQSVSLKECMDTFLQEEVLDGDDAWHCPRCNTRRRSTKRLSIAKLPPVLIVHLKRFYSRGPWREKLNTLVDLPLRHLNLTKYLSEAQVAKVTDTTYSYDLYALVNHYGNLNGGHYTAFVRNGYRGVWMSFDDSRISTITAGEIGVSRERVCSPWAAKVSDQCRLYRVLCPEQLHVMIFRSNCM